MHYYELIDDVDVPGRWHLSRVRIADGAIVHFIDGRAVHLGAPVFTVIHHGVRPLDYCVTSFGVPVVSVRLADTISTVAGSDLQRVPLHISGYPGFEVLNVLRTVKCLDEARSDFIRWTEHDFRPDKIGDYRNVTKLRLDPSLIPEDAHLFRVHAYRIALIVSETLKNAMEKAGCLGAKFQLVTD